jgi:hypothetical protein
VWDYIQVLSRWAIGLGGIFYVQHEHTTIAQTIAVFVGSIAAIALMQLGIDAIRGRNRPQ